MKSETPEAAGKASLDPLVLRALAKDPALIEIGRKAIEAVLVDLRERRISQPFLGNGLGIKEKDGKDMAVMLRMGPDDGLRIGLNAIADHVEQNNSLTVGGTPLVVAVQKVTRHEGWEVIGHVPDTSNVGLERQEPRQ